MKFNLNNVFSFSLFFLLVNTCAKDADEDQTIDEETFIRQMNRENRIEDRKAMATADWEAFMKEAHELMIITENNFKSLNSKIDKAPDVQQVQLKISLRDSKNDFDHLKDSLQAHDILLRAALRNWDKKMIRQHNYFKKKFRNELVDINNRLEKAIDNP